MMTGALLVEKLYSQGYYIEKQREFSIISGSKKVINKLTKNVDDSTLRDSKDLLDSDLKHYKARRDLYYKIPLLKSLKPRKES